MLAIGQGRRVVSQSTTEAWGYGLELWLRKHHTLALLLGTTLTLALVIRPTYALALVVRLTLALALVVGRAHTTCRL